jgi:putative pyruvate formate lyase activating enzyme
MPAAYLSLHRSGELARRARAAVAALADCTICPQACHVDRLTAAAGDIRAGAVCMTGRHARVAAVGPGFRDEPVLVGDGGTGDILFSWCNLRCVYCENSAVSLNGQGEDMDAEALAEAMLSLQAQGCHSVHLIGPGHVVPQILEALVLAADRGLTLPLVYNSGGYDAVGTLRLLDGVVDIYTPDMKYADDLTGRRCSKVRDYVAVNRAAVAEMVRQVGPLTVDRDGLARRGVLVRHLLLPRDLGNVTRVLDVIRDVAGPGTAVSLLDDFRPAHMADRVPELREPVRAELAARAHAYAAEQGLVPLSASVPVAASLPN